MCEKAVALQLAVQFVAHWDSHVKTPSVLQTEDVRLLKMPQCALMFVCVSL